MAETDEALIEVLTEGLMCQLGWNSPVQRGLLRSALREDAIPRARAAGYTISPPGSLVIPPLDTPEGQRAVERALLAASKAYSEPMKAALRAAGAKA